MTGEKMLYELNDQVHAELFSEYLYLSMAAWLDQQGLKGSAHFFKVQAAEERIHAMKFYDYINNAGGKVTLKGFDQPRTDFGSITGIFEAALKHEKYITGRINDLVSLAKKDNDTDTERFLGWFVSEQEEEEENMADALKRSKEASVEKNALKLLDEQLGMRKYPA